MKRAILVGGGTLAGVAAVLALNPDAPISSAAPTSVSSGTTSGSTGDGSYAGDVVDIGRDYGSIQVEISVEGGRVVDVTTLEVPQNDRRSAQISDVAIPFLIDQALEAQSSDVAGVSGATYTANGFASSLRSALVAAGLA